MKTESVRDEMTSRRGPAIDRRDVAIGRRDAFRITGLVGGGLAVSLWDSPLARALAQDSSPAAGEAEAFNPFLKLHPDNTLEFVLDRVEMGQGTLTSQVVLACEELDYPPEKVKVVQAPRASEYNNTMFRSQMTGGSTSVVEGHEKLREAGAKVRARIVKAAARKWGVKEDQISTAEGEVFVASDSNRRSTYGALATLAVDESAGSVELKPWGEHRYIGKPLPRLDRVEKSTGRAMYGIDAAPPGMLVAVLVRPPAQGAEVDSFSDGEALKKPGVKSVFQAAGGVAVLAERYWQARAGASALNVRWIKDKAFNKSEADLAALFQKEVEQEGESVRSDGDFAQAYREAEKKILADYHLPYLAHATMEPQSAVCLYNQKAGKNDVLVEIWSSSQVPDTAVSEVAALLDCKKDQVRFHNHLLGGGFGRRLRPDYIVEALEVARLSGLNSPVMVQWSREDDMKNDDFRPMAACRMMGSVDDKGKLSSFFYRNASQSLMRSFAPGFVKTLFPQWVPSGLKRFVGNTMGSFASGLLAMEGVKDMPYACENVSLEYRELELPVRIGFWRSVGHSINGFVVESFIDELAHLAGADPFEFRKQHLADDNRLKPVLERVASLSGWGGSLPEGQFEGIASHKSFESYVAEVVRLSVKEGQVRVHEVFCVVDCGRVVNPAIVKAQMESGIVYGLAAALTGKITHSNGEVVQSNFHDYPVLRMNEHPKITVEIVESKESPTGVGEPGTPPIAAAVCNALFKATGKRIRRLPLSKSLA